MAKIRSGWLKGIVNGISTRLYAWSHAEFCLYGDPSEGITVKDKIDELNSELSVHPFKADFFLSIEAGGDNKIVIDPVSDTLPDGMYIVKIWHSNLGNNVLSGIVFVAQGYASFYGYKDVDGTPQRETTALKIPCQGWGSRISFYKVYDE